MRYTLDDTIEWMKSDDYKTRMKAEYWQLRIRMEKLRLAIVKNKGDKLMSKQLMKMFEYSMVLEKRADYLGVYLDNDDIAFPIWMAE